MVDKLCTGCGETKPLTAEYFHRRAGNKFQSRCKACQLLARRGWVANNEERASAMNKAWRDANRPHVNSKRRENRSKNLERHREHDRVRNASLRLETIEAYGGACSCCGETQLAFLAIDHINEDGAEHRKLIGGSSSLCRWLKKHGFPKDGFQLLCHNCNMAKSFYGGCPHRIAELPYEGLQRRRMRKEADRAQVPTP